MEDKNNKNYEEINEYLILFFDIENILKNENIANLISQDFKKVLEKYTNCDGSIFDAYNFLDDEKEGLLKINNSLFIQILRLIESKENDNNLNMLISKVKSIIINNKTENLEYLLTFILLLNLYLKENVWGPSFTFIKETEKVDFKKEIDKFNNNYFNRLNENQLLYEKDIYNELNIYGEDLYKYSKFIIFYYIPFYFLNNFKKDKEVFKYINCILNDNKIYSLKIWQIRLLRIYNELISEPIDNIYNDILKIYEELKLEKFIKNNEIYGKLLIEKSYFYMKYFHYKKCTTTYELAKEKLKIDISLTGKIGKKTKYQTFENPILVVDVKNQANNLNEQNKDIGNLNINLDSVRTDNPLLEKPILSNKEEEEIFNNQVVTLNDQLYLCSVLNFIERGLPDEDMNREIVLSYTEKGLKYSHDWLIYSKLQKN